MSVEIVTRNESGVGLIPGVVNASRERIGDDTFVFGVAPADSVRLVYEPSAGPSVGLEQYTRTSPAASVFGQFIESDERAWNIIAYDADGAVLYQMG